MNYAIETLTRELEVLDNSYERFVTNGGVDKNNLSATKNREKAKELREAIELLNQNK